MYLVQAISPSIWKGWPNVLLQLFPVARLPLQQSFYVHSWIRLQCSSSPFLATSEFLFFPSVGHERKRHSSFGSLDYLWMYFTHAFWVYLGLIPGKSFPSYGRLFLCPSNFMSQWVLPVTGSFVDPWSDMKILLGPYNILWAVFKQKVVFCHRTPRVLYCDFFFGTCQRLHSLLIYQG